MQPKPCANANLGRDVLEAQAFDTSQHAKRVSETPINVTSMHSSSCAPPRTPIRTDRLLGSISGSQIHFGLAGHLADTKWDATRHHMPQTFVKLCNSADPIRTERLLGSVSVSQIQFGLAGHFADTKWDASGMSS